MSTSSSTSTSAPVSPDPASARPAPHTWVDDVQGFVIAALTCSLGVLMYSFCSLLTGGTAGLAFLLHYLTDLPFGLLFFIINAPFYWFGWHRMGRVFTLKTFIAVTLVSVMVDLMPHMLRIDFIQPVYAMAAGGVLMGASILMFIRHRASLGGISIMALWLQQVHGIRAGKVQMVADLLILGGALFILPLDRALLSILGAVVFNLVLAINHKPGRYMGF